VIFETGWLTVRSCKNTDSSAFSAVPFSIAAFKGIQPFSAGSEVCGFGMGETVECPAYYKTCNGSEGRILQMYIAHPAIQVAQRGQFEDAAGRNSVPEHVFPEQQLKLFVGHGFHETSPPDIRYQYVLHF
jgi:hypothetical protein